MTAGVPESGAPVVSIDGREIAARFTTNGLCAVEADFHSLEQIGKDMEAGRATFSVVRALFRSLFLHALPDLSAVEAGRVLQALGTDAAAQIIQRAFDSIRGGSIAPLAIPDADQQGRVAFEAGGVRYVLTFHFNALAEMEPMFPGKSMLEIGEELLSGGVSLSRMRGMFRAAIIDQQEVSLFEAGDIIDRIGIRTASDAVGKAFLAAFPKVAPLVPEDDGDREVDGNRQARRAAGKGKGNPTKPRRRKAGTGTP